MIAAWFGGVKRVAVSPVAWDHLGGYLLGRALFGLPRVLRGLQGSACRAERSEPLWFPGVLGQALLPGREDSLGVFEGGPGVRGRRPPAVSGGREGSWLLAGPG